MGRVNVILALLAAVVLRGALAREGANGKQREDDRERGGKQRSVQPPPGLTQKAANLRAQAELAGMSVRYCSAGKGATVCRNETCQVVLFDDHIVTASCGGGRRLVDNPRTIWYQPEPATSRENENGVRQIGTSCGIQEFNLFRPYNYTKTLDKMCHKHYKVRRSAADQMGPFAGNVAAQNTATPHYFLRYRAKYPDYNLNQGFWVKTFDEMGPGSTVFPVACEKYKLYYDLQNWMWGCGVNFATTWKEFNVCTSAVSDGVCRDWPCADNGGC